MCCPNQIRLLLLEPVTSTSLTSSSPHRLFSASLPGAYWATKKQHMRINRYASRSTQELRFSHFFNAEWLHGRSQASQVPRYYVLATACREGFLTSTGIFKQWSNDIRKPPSQSVVVLLERCRQKPQVLCRFILEQRNARALHLEHVPGRCPRLRG